MTSMGLVMYQIRAPNGEGNYLLEIRQFLWTHRSEKDTDLVIISGKECVKVHEAILLPMSSHRIDVLPPSCPCTKPALCLPPFPNHILAAAVEILYVGKATGLASQEDLVKIKEVFSFLKIKVDIIADDYEGGNIEEHDKGNLIKTDKRDDEPSSSPSYLNEVTGQFHYHERSNELELNKNDTNLEGQLSSSGRYIDEFSNFIFLNSGSGVPDLELSRDVGSNFNIDKTFTPIYKRNNVEKTYTDENWNDLKRTNANEGYNFRPIKEKPRSPHSQGPLVKLKPRKKKAKEREETGTGKDGKNILSPLKYKPGNKKQKISTTTESSKKYPCCKCNYESNDKSNFQRHFEMVHQKVSLNCNQCNFQTTHKRYLQRHIATMHEKHFYYCEQCEYKTKRKYMLKVHNRSAHENIFHHCDHCDYKTGMKQSLKTHIESVHEKISYECNECRFKSTRKDFLKVHIKRKHYEVPFSGYQENGRTTNEETFTGKISYYCDQCEYKSTKKWQLKRHIDCIHEKNIFHYCDQCDYKTTWKYNLKTHIESVHQKISYSCNDCGYKTTRKDCLRVHIKRKHAGVSYSGYQGTLLRELPVRGKSSSNFQIQTPNLSQDQVVNVSSKSTNSDDHGPVDDE